MQLAFDAADRLVELVQARRGAGRRGGGRARAVRARACARDARPLASRRRRRGRRAPRSGSARESASPARAASRRSSRTPSSSSSTSRRPGSRRARDRDVRDRGGSCARARDRGGRSRRSSTLASRCLLQIATLTGIREAELRRAPRAEIAVRRFLAFAGDAPLVAHNARFDVGFLDHEVARLTGKRVAAPVVDTVWLAARLLHRRSERFSLWLARALLRDDVEAVPPRSAGCARDGRDPDRSARPGAGARSEDARGGHRARRAPRPQAPLEALARRRCPDERPASTSSATATSTVLYVGKARDLRARLRSYFSGDRQRPAVEAALGALERVEWRVLGSELEAALEELRLIRELRPPANARATRPDRSVYLERRDEKWKVVSAPGPLGPIGSKRRAQLAARALDGFEGERPRRSARSRCGEAHAARAATCASRTRRACATGSPHWRRSSARVEELEGLRRSRLCVLAPAREPGLRRAFFVAGGRVRARTLAPGPAGSARGRGGAG